MLLLKIQQQDKVRSDVARRQNAAHLTATPKQQGRNNCFVNNGVDVGTQCKDEVQQNDIFAEAAFVYMMMRQWPRERSRREYWQRLRDRLKQRIRFLKNKPPAVCPVEKWVQASLGARSVSLHKLTESGRSLPIPSACQVYSFIHVLFLRIMYFSSCA